MLQKGINGILLLYNPHVSLIQGHIEFLYVVKRSDLVLVSISMNNQTKCYKKLSLNMRRQCWQSIVCSGGKLFLLNMRYSEG